MKRYEDETTGIYLRPIEWGDTELIIRWRNADFVRKRFIYQELFTRESHEHWLRTQVETGKVVQTIICDRETDEPLGSVYIRDIDTQNKKAEYGIFLGDPAVTGKGIGTAAARLMLQYCFEEAGLHRIYLRVFADNARAIASYERAGFQREGYLRGDVCIDGEFRDIVWMAALADK